MSAMQHALGRSIPLSYPAGFPWPPISYPSPSNAPFLLSNCKVLSVSNILIKKHTEVVGGFLKGKKNDGATYKCIGIRVSIPESARSSFADSVDAFVEGFPGEYPKPNVADGDGEHYTLFGAADVLAVLRNSLGYVGDDVLRSGDVVKLEVKNGTLFLLSVEVLKQERGKEMDSQHKVTNLYHAPAVNVDEGLVDNMAKKQAEIDRMREREALKKKEQEEAEGEAAVDDDEWDD